MLTKNNFFYNSDFRADLQYQRIRLTFEIYMYENSTEIRVCRIDTRGSLITLLQTESFSKAFIQYYSLIKSA